MKVCVDCGLDKALDEFGNYSASPDGKARYCKSCAKVRRDGRSPKARVNVSTASLKSNVTRAAITDFIQPKELLATFAAVQMGAQDGESAPNFLFKGPSGSGKTESARDLAKRAGLPFFKVDAPAQVDPEAWFGTREVVDGDKGPVTKYNESLFATALQQPCVLLIDEVNRVSDAVRQILLPLFDDSRQVTNPLTGQVIHRHPLCFVFMTANVGIAFTGTYAIDPAFLTRALTTNFAYLDRETEMSILISRTGCDPMIANDLVAFAAVTRERAAQDEDFPPVSTRELLSAARLAARGLDVTIAVNQAIVNAASDEGAAESIRASLTYAWEGVRNPTTADVQFAQPGA